MNPKEIIHAYSDAVKSSQLGKAISRSPHQPRDFPIFDDRLKSAGSLFDDWTDTLPDGNLKEQAKLTRMIGSMLASEEQPATPLKGKFAEAGRELLRLLDDQEQ
jgi:hypothetical protein